MGPHPPPFAAPASTSAAAGAAPLQPSTSPCKHDRSPHPPGGLARSTSLNVHDGPRRRGPWEALQSRTAVPNVLSSSGVGSCDRLASGAPPSASASSSSSSTAAASLAASQANEQNFGSTPSPNFFTSRRPTGSLGSLYPSFSDPVHRTASPSLGLSRLTLPDGSISSAYNTAESTPAPSVRSPALSFLSAFSSPPASVAIATPPPSLSSAATSIIISPDDAGQPAGDSSATEVLGKLLGKGASGVVREVVSAVDGERVHPPQAVKVVLLRPQRTSPDEPESMQVLDDIRDEIALWESLPAHQGILPLHRHVVTPDAVYLFMPFMPGGSLFDVVRRHKEHDRGRGQVRPRLFSSSRILPVQITDDVAGTKAFPHDEARKYFGDVVRGVAALHAAGVVHGDLKCENILINAEGHCRLSDFGFSARMPVPAPTPSTSSSTWSSALPTPTGFDPRGDPLRLAPLTVHAHRRHFSQQSRQASSPFPTRSPSAESAPTLSGSIGQIPPGSLPYTAPELLRPPAGAQLNKPTTATDVWALGVLLYFLVTSGSFPFADAFEPRLQLKIIRGVWALPDGIEVGKECMDVLKGCLESEVSERWSIEEVLSSEWLQGWEEVKNRSRSRSRARSTPRGTRGASRSRSRASDRRSDGGFKLSTSMDRLAVTYPSSSSIHHNVLGSPSMTESTESFPPTPNHSMSPPPSHHRRSKSLAQASAEAPTFSPSRSRSRSRSRGRSSRPRRDGSPPREPSSFSSLTPASSAADCFRDRSLSRGRPRNSIYHDGQEVLGRGRPRTPSALSTFQEEEAH